MTSVAVLAQSDELKKLYKCCRLCLGEECLDDMFNDEELLQLLSDFLAIKVSTEDRMSHKICAICRIRLTEIQEFRASCQEVQEVLQSMIRDELAMCDRKHPGLDRSHECQEQESPSYGESFIESHTEVHSKLMKEVKAEPLAGEDFTFGIHKQIIELSSRAEADPASDNLNYEVSGLHQKSVAVALSDDIVQKQEDESRFGPIDIEDMLNLEDVKIEFRSDDYLESADMLPDKQSSTVSKIDDNDEFNDSEQTSENTDLVLQCHICYKLFYSRQQISAHKKSAHGSKKYGCTMCEKRFTYQAELEKHIAKYERDHKIKQAVQTVQCNVCHTFYRNEQQLQIHNNNIHGTKNQSLQCDICHKVCLSRSALVQHKKTQHGPIQIMCHLCGIIFNTRSHLKKHEGTKNHLKKMQKISANPALAVKSIQPESVPNEPGNDSATSYPFQVRQSADGHQLWQCRLCRKLFPSDSSLKEHVTSHESKKAECPICQRPVNNRRSLRTHIKTHDNIRTQVRKRTLGAESFKCEICQKVFRGRDAIQRHKKQTHGPKIHECHYCEFKCSIRIGLQRHLKKHRREKNEQLPKQQTHGPKKYSCTICNKSWRTS